MGRTWKISAITAEAYVRRFKDEYAGITLPVSAEIVINREDLTVATIAHELVHAALDGLCVSAASLNASQQEEVYCELFALHGDSLLRLAKKLHRVLRKG